MSRKWACNFRAWSYRPYSYKAVLHLLLSSLGEQHPDLKMLEIGLCRYRQFHRHKCLKNLPGTLSGPLALLGSIDNKSFKMPRDFTLIGPREGSLSFSGNFESILGEGSEKTELNCSCIISAFLRGSVMSKLFLSFKSEMPIFSVFLLLM